MLNISQLSPIVVLHDIRSLDKDIAAQKDYLKQLLILLQPLTQAELAWCAAKEIVEQNAAKGEIDPVAIEAEKKAWQHYNALDRSGRYTQLFEKGNQHTETLKKLERQRETAVKVYHNLSLSWAKKEIQTDVSVIDEETRNRQFYNTKFSV